MKGHKMKKNQKKLQNNLENSKKVHTFALALQNEWIR